MNYASEIEGPSRQITNVISAAVPSPNYQTTLQSLVPFEQQREQTISHLTKEYDIYTQEAIQTKEQTDLVNEAGRYLKNAQNKNTSLKTDIEKNKQELETLKKELQLQMSKQKIVFDLFIVFGATITVYLLFRSFSFVHMIALFVLILGTIYVFNYNAYRIRLFSFDTHTTIPSLPAGNAGSYPWWKPSFISA